MKLYLIICCFKLFSKYLDIKRNRVSQHILINHYFDILKKFIMHLANFFLFQCSISVKEKILSKNTLYIYVKRFYKCKNQSLLS